MNPITNPIIALDATTYGGTALGKKILEAFASQETLEEHVWDMLPMLETRRELQIAAEYATLLVQGKDKETRQWWLSDVVAGLWTSASMQVFKFVQISAKAGEIARYRAKATYPASEYVCDDTIISITPTGVWEVYEEETDVVLAHVRLAQELAEFRAGFDSVCEMCGCPATHSTKIKGVWNLLCTQCVSPQPAGHRCANCGNLCFGLQREINPNVPSGIHQQAAYAHICSEHCFVAVTSRLYDPFADEGVTLAERDAAAKQEEFNLYWD